MKKVVRFFRVAFGVFCILIAAGGIVATIQEHQPAMLILVAVFAVLAFLLFRKKKEGIPSPATSALAPDAPEDILKDMRRHYTVVQAQEDARVMSDSFKLIQQTTSFDTFLSRLEIAQQKALTLLQADKSGCDGIGQIVPACEAVLTGVQSVKITFLNNTYLKETNAALMLKTPAGQRKRLEAYLTALDEHREDFLDVEDAYLEVISKTRELMA